MQHFAVTEVDHVWRLICNAHICSKSLGVVVHVCGHSLDVKAGGEVEARVNTHARTHARMRMYTHAHTTHIDGSYNVHAPRAPPREKAALGDHVAQGR